MKSIPNVLRLLAASLTCASLLHAETETAPIPFSEIGAKATADYQGDAIDITRTREGARLHTGFQKLVGNVTPEGLTLVSTEEGGGSLKLTATSIGRELADAPSPLLLPTSGKVSGNNPFANAAATWALLHQLTLYCLYSDLQRPGGDPPGLLTETFTTTGGGYLWATFSGQPGGQGNADGTGAAARFDNPAGIISDNNGGFFVADSNNHVIRRVYSSGVVTPFAGSTQMFGSSNGTGNAASFHGPAGLALKPVGFLVVANVLNSTIRQMSPSGEVTLQAGSPGVAGSQSGTGTGTRFSRPAGIVIRADLPRPGGNSPGLLTEAVTDTNSQTFYIVVDTANLPTLDVTGLGIDTNNPANIAALDNIASAGIRVVGAENTLPTAAATFTVLDPIDRTVSLNGSASSDPDGDIVSYTWSWNGGSATGINPIANFALGETQVTLTVTDNRGGTSSTTLTVVIPEPPSGMAQVAYIKASNTGAAYVFSRIGTEWNQLAYLKPSNRATEDFFGFGHRPLRRRTCR